MLTLQLKDTDWLTGFKNTIQVCAAARDKPNWQRNTVAEI
jgi:hypothetical protein